MTADGTPADVKRLGAYLFCSPATIRAALQKQGISLSQPRPERRLGEILVESGAVSVDELDAAVRAQRIARLRACQLFAGLSKMELSALSAHFQEISTVPGEQFITEAAEDSTLYVIASGLVEVFRTDEEGREIVLASVGPGEPIGEMGYFAGGVRTASVRALQSTELLRAGYENLTEYFENVPHVAHAFIEVVEKRRANTARSIKADARDRQLIRNSLPQLKGLVDLAQPQRGLQRAQKRLERQLVRAGKELDADRISLFILQNDGETLQSVFAQGIVGRTLRQNIAHGIAGWVYSECELANVADAYEDERFDKSQDELSGYQTHTVLAAPVKGAEGVVLGVVEAVNKGLGAFTEEDEHQIQNFARQLANALDNFSEYRQSVGQFQRVAAALETATVLQHSKDTASIITAIQDSTKRQLACDACQLLLIDREKNSLRTSARDGSGEQHFELGEVPTWRVAIEGNVFEINAGTREEDLLETVGALMNIDKPAAALCVPVLGAERQIVALLQVARVDGGAFESEEIVLLRSIAAQIGNAGVFA